jgi:hypothetical protein
VLKRSTDWERRVIDAVSLNWELRVTYRGVVELVPTGQLVEVAPVVFEVVPAVFVVPTDEVVPFWVFVVVPLVAGV